jgi:hypothetical protein
MGSNISSTDIAGFFPSQKSVWNRDNITSITTILQAGLSLVRFLVEAKNLTLLQNFLTDSGAHPASFSMGTGKPFPGWGFRLTTCFYPVPRLRMSRAVPPLLPHAFITCTGEKSTFL